MKDNSGEWIAALIKAGQWLVFAVVAAFFIVATFLYLYHNNTDQHYDTNNPPSPLLASPPPPIPPPSSANLDTVELVDFDAGWTKTSRGFTLADGVLWVPIVRVTAKNTGPTDVRRYALRVLFLDEKGTITAEEKESIYNIPAGYAKGPVFLRGAVGYTHDYPLTLMANRKSDKWRFELFYSSSSDGPWKSVKSGEIPVPMEK